MTEVEAHADGTFSMVAVGLDRIACEHLDTTGAYPVGQVEARPEEPSDVPPEIVERPGRSSRPTGRRCRSSATTPHRRRCRATRRTSPGRWPPCAPLPLHERQALLEAEDAAVRLQMVTELLRAELRAMNVIPSLPATEVARTRWSPN